MKPWTSFARLLTSLLGIDIFAALIMASVIKLAVDSRSSGSIVVFQFEDLISILNFS